MTNRWILRAAAASLVLTGIALGLGAGGFIRISHARKTSLQDWNARRCAVYQIEFGAENPCNLREEWTREPMFATLKAGNADVAHARGALLANDEAAAAVALVRALDRASALEKRSSYFATAISARVVADVLDVLDADPALARRPDIRAALQRTKLSTAQRPLEAQRLRVVEKILEQQAARTAFVTWGAADKRVADEVEAEDAALLAMQRAARAGDQARCERVQSHSLYAVGACSSVMKTMKTARRLDSARSRSLATDERLDLRSR